MSFATLTLDASYNPIPLSADLCFISNGMAQCDYLLPIACNIGDTFRVFARDNLWKISQNASQKIILGDSSTTTGVTGNLIANKLTDAVEITCIDTTATNFRCMPISGNPTII